MPIEEDRRLPVGMLIGDEWVTTTSAGDIEHIRPSTGTVQRRFPVAGRDEINAAVMAAREALPVWRSWEPRARRDALHRVAQLFRKNAAEFGTIGTLESGILKAQSDYMALYAAEWFDYYAGWVDKPRGEVIAVPGSFDYTLTEPVGVVAVLMTWNGPTGSLGMTCAAPLAAGCSIVLKAPELAPFSSTLFGRLCQEAGLPPGVVNVVVGGPDAGNALVTHPAVAKISFTGSVAVARQIQVASAACLTPALFELGGKSANIVFGDADLDAAVAFAVDGVCQLNGQTCIAPTRLLVEESAYEKVLNGVVNAVAAVRVGDPFDSTTQVGPVISQSALERILATIEAARSDAASGDLVEGGIRVSGELAGGFYLRPAVFAGSDNQSPLAQNEVFGPVVAVIPFTSEAHVLKLANDTSYGLAAYLHTTDIDRVHRMASKLHAGNIAVNGGAALAGPYAPFGGFNHSGYGKQGGSEGLREFLRTKNVNILTTDREA